ncbi:hypothetical protein M9458_019904, partial [Cirrhinus mrigala]
ISCSQTVFLRLASVTSCLLRTRLTASMKKCRSRWCRGTGTHRRGGLMPFCRLQFA